MVPPQLDFITLKALAKKTNRRYQTAKELIADLNAVKERLEEASGQTLIRRTSPPVLTGHGNTFTNLSQILRRPRIPISYILLERPVADRRFRRSFTRPRPHKPPAEAQRWYEIGTPALRVALTTRPPRPFKKRSAPTTSFCSRMDV